MSGKVLVVGLGNSLMADDGAGIAVAELLRARDLPGDARAEVGDTDSLRILSLWQGEPEIWLVDALLQGSPPGTIHRLSHEAVLSIPQPHAAAHYLSLPESLRWIAAARPEMKDVRYRLYGIEPEIVEMKPGLSEHVGEAAEALAGELLGEMRRLCGG